MKRIAHWLFLHGMRVVLPRRFDPGAARELRATFELRVRDPCGRPPAQFSLEVADGACTVRPGPAPGAGAAATVSARDMLALVLGETGWPELVSSGRLQLSGDPFLAMRFPLLFRLPVRSAAQ